MNKVAVLTISDRCSCGERIDTSGPIVCNLLEDNGYEIIYTKIIPDEINLIKEELIYCVDTLEVALVLTTGGTGFAKRDVTPEATKAIIEKEVPGIPELMRYESMKITNRACLSRAITGIRKNSLIINLPGSKKAAAENLQVVLPVLEHGLKMLLSDGSADCSRSHGLSNEQELRILQSDGSKDCKLKSMQERKVKATPIIDEWLKEAKKDINAKKVGMYLTHNGVVRETPRAVVRKCQDEKNDSNQLKDTYCSDNIVKALEFSYNRELVSEAIEETKNMAGIFYVRVWLNEGSLTPGDDLMLVLVGGDIRPHVIDALQFLVDKIKKECVVEKEVF